MTRVRLEIDKVIIHRPKKRWKLYFVIIAEHPTDKEKMILTTVPLEPIKLSKRHENSFSFDTKNIGVEGLFVLSRELPKTRELNVHIYLRHTRKKARNMGELLDEIAKKIGGDTLKVVKDLMGSATIPWLVIAKEILPLIGMILSKIPDRDFGFLSAFEHFGSEFEEQTDIDRKKNFSGDASLVYSWSIEK